MLFLTFRIGGENYALDAGLILEILPLLRIAQVPHAPAGVAGLIAYRGRSVPVVDLSELLLGEPARPHISTRLILVHHGEHLLGLIAEQATETMRREAASFAVSGVTSVTAPYLGPVAHDGDRVIRRFDVHKLPAALGGALFRPVEQHP